MKEITGSLALSGQAERRVSRQQLARGFDADAGVEAERMRRREALLHRLEVSRRLRQRRLTTRLT